MNAIVVEVPTAFKSFKSGAVCLQQLLTLAASACERGQTDAPMPFAELGRAFALGAGELQRGFYEPVLASMARDEPHLWIGDTLHVRAGLAATTD